MSDPVLLSSARKKPLQEPMKTRSPATVGVEKTQPPASNVQETARRSALGRPVAALVVDGGSVHSEETTPKSRLSRLSRYARMKPCYVHPADRDRPFSLPKGRSLESVLRVNLIPLARFGELERLNELIGGSHVIGSRARQRPSRFSKASLSKTSRRGVLCSATSTYWLIKPSW
jgi:hypothetical protein